MSNSPIDIESVRIRSGSRSRGRRQSSTTTPADDWFLKGPIPGAWLRAAAALPGHALHVGLAIWYQKGLTKKNEVKITSRTREKFSLLPDAYRRGLKELESAGLVTVRRSRGQCAEITTLDSRSSGQERSNTTDPN
ncbi:MAG: hypothetical protein KDA60_18275 [Planctomycetales bacterium]|nr:hypothetical protein [Planctomycetales bacterium]